ncbi:MAG: DUF5723 family protein [Bacteroidales bacterium]|nr:DUF5723 family protein [Bacteroidales bacterium]
MLDNYSGSSSAWLNPSNISTTFVHDDIGLMSLSFSLENNFAYLPFGTMWPSLFGLMSDGGTWAEFEGLQPDHPYYYKYYPSHRDRYAYEAMDLVLPSMMMTFARNHSVAFSLRSRVYTSATRMPWEIPVLVTESLDFADMQHIRYASEGMRLTAMAWEEADLTYSTKVFDYGDVKMEAGVTGKLLLGMAGGSLRTDVLDYMVLNKDELQFYGLDATMNLCSPMDYHAQFNNMSSLMNFTSPIVKGLGVGGDVGFSLTSKKNAMIRPSDGSACEDRPEDYYWRLGVSFLDFGKVAFKSNTVQGRLIGENFIVNLDDFSAVTAVTDVDDLLNEAVGNEVSAFRRDSVFSIGLPTALSVQFDMNLDQRFYCNMTWIQPMSRLLYDVAVEREPLLSLTPRYESSLVSVALPVTLYDYRYVTAGVFFRVGPFTMGTNDFFSLAGLGRTRSVDFLVSFRLKLDRGDCLFGRVYDACGDKVRRLRR